MPPENLDSLTTVYGPATWDVYDKLDQGLSPAGPDELFEIAGALLTPGLAVLDAGCRDAGHLIKLVRRFDVTGVGVEPVPIHVERAHTAVDESSLSDRITVHETMIQSMPIPDDSIDLVWTRNVFEQLDDVDGALAQLARVAKPGAPMVVYTTVVTDSLNDRERAMLGRHMGNIDENLDRSWLEQRFADAGIEIETARSVGTEWCEFAEERVQPVSTALLRLARLRRRADEIVADHGAEIYGHIEANLNWEVFLFLGKLEPLIYTLRFPQSPEDTHP